MNYPTASITAHKRKSDGSADTTNLMNKTVSFASNQGTGLVNYDSYKNLVNNWMNKEKYGTGVVYKISLTDDNQLTSWKWEVNTPGITDLDASNYKTLSTSNEGKNTQTINETRQDIIVDFHQNGYRYGRLTVTDIAGNIKTIDIAANIDVASPTCSVTFKGTERKKVINIMYAMLILIKMELTFVKDDLVAQK